MGQTFREMLRRIAAQALPSEPKLIRDDVFDGILKRGRGKRKEVPIARLAVGDECIIRLLDKLCEESGEVFQAARAGNAETAHAREEVMEEIADFNEVVADLRKKLRASSVSREVRIAVIKSIAGMETGVRSVRKEFGIRHREVKEKMRDKTKRLGAFKKGVVLEGILNLTGIGKVVPGLNQEWKLALADID